MWAEPQVLNTAIFLLVLCNETVSIAVHPEFSQDVLGTACVLSHTVNVKCVVMALQPLHCVDKQAVVHASNSTHLCPKHQFLIFTHGCIESHDTHMTFL